MDREPPSEAGGAQPRTSNEVSGTVNGPVVQAGRIDNVHLHAAPVALMVPKTLPNDVRAFVNRSQDLAKLNAWVEQAHAAGRTAFALVTGVGGVGKTCTAVHWAHTAKARFTGGQLYADLGGSAPTGPVHPYEVLGEFLRLLGCPATDVPVTEDVRSALFRSLVADRDIVIVLDDALSAAQVRGLLPAGPRAAVVVTSRSRLDDLLVEQFELLSLEPFTPETAVDLVVATIDAARAAAEPDALRALASLCDGLPLALQIAACQLITRHRGPVSRYVRRLRDRRELLTALDVTPEQRIVALFDFSYGALAGEQARAYRLLALWPGQGFGIPMAAALLGRSEDDAETLLESLVRDNLLSAPGDDRYEFHSLVRHHARTRCEQIDTEDERRAAVSRAVEWYLRFAVARDALVANRPPLNPELYEQSATVPGDRDTALAELDAERGNLYAAVHAANDYDLTDRPWQLCGALFIFYQTYDYYPDWLDTHELAVSAARRAGDRHAELRMLSQLGAGYFAVRESQRAMGAFTESGQIAADLGDILGQQSSWEWCGFVYEVDEDDAQMLECLLRSRTFAERLNDDRRPRAIALLDMHTGRALKNLGRFDEAIDMLRDAHIYFLAQPKEKGNVAKTLTTLGQALLGAGRTEQALSVLREALSTFGEREALAWQAELLAAIAVASERLGDAVAAAQYRDRAAAVESTLGDQRAAVLRSR